MTNPNEAALKLNKANAALLKTGLLGNAKRSLTFITLIWMSVLAAHIYLRFPWGGKDITHSKWCCAYLILPALLAVILSVVRAFKTSLENPNEALTSKMRTIYQTSNQTGKNNRVVQSAGWAVAESAALTFMVLLVILPILSIACMAVAGCLDRATDSSKIKGLSIAECTLLAGIIITLIAFTFSFYLAAEGRKISQQSNPRIIHFIGVEETQMNSGRAQTI